MQASEARVSAAFSSWAVEGESVLKRDFAFASLRSGSRASRRAFVRALRRLAA